MFSNLQSKLLSLLGKCWTLYAFVRRKFLLSNKDLKRFISLNANEVEKIGIGKSTKVNLRDYESRDEIYVLPIAYLETKYLHIRISDGRMLSESTCWPDPYVLLSRPTSLSIPLIFYESLDSEKPIIALSSESYYHWLIEQLPIFLKLLKAVPSSLIIYNKNAPKHIHDLLNILNVESRPVNKFVKMENLLFIPRVKSAGSALPSDIRLLREYFKKRIENQSTVLNQKSNKIYISRQNSSRSPAFEAQLEAYLTTNGWIVILAEKMSLLEQFSIFSKARVVMALHGAGLSNIAFMPTKGKVIEIRLLLSGHFHGDYMSNCYKNLSLAAGHDYYSIQLESKYFNSEKIPPEILKSLGSLSMNSKDS